MDKLNKLINFLERLENVKIYYRLNKIRDSILVEIAVPGERWEVEFMADDADGIVVERFKSNGEIFDEKELDVLFRDFSD